MYLLQTGLFLIRNRQFVTKARESRGKIGKGWDWALFPTLGYTLSRQHTSEEAGGSRGQLEPNKQTKGALSPEGDAGVWPPWTLLPAHAAALGKALGQASRFHPEDSRGGRRVLLGSSPRWGRSLERGKGA